MHTGSVINKFANSLLSCTLILLVSTPASAQGLLEEIVVTAQKREENLQEVPLTVSAFTGSALDRLVITQTKELGELVPGLEIHGTGDGKKEFFLRGVGVEDFQASAGNAVAIYHDGLVFGATVGTTGLFFDLDRIEVLKGPQGTLWGKNTTAGLINIVARKPEVGGDANGYLSTLIGNYGRVEVEGAVGFSIGEHWAARVSAKRSEFNGYHTNVNPDPAFFGKNEGGIDHWDVFRVQLAWEPNDDLNVRLLYSSSNLEGDTYPSKSLGAIPLPGCENPGRIGSTCGNAASVITFALPPGTPGTSLDTDIHTTEETFETFENIEHRQGGLFVDYNFNDYELSVIFGMSETERLHHANTHGAVAHISQSGFDDHHSQLSVEARLASNYDSPINWVAGIYYYEDDLDYFRSNFFSIFGGSSAGRFMNSKATNTAGFGHLTYEITDRLTLIGGLRVTHDEREGNLVAGGLVSNPALRGVSLDQGTWFSQPAAFINRTAVKKEDWTELSWRATLSYALNEQVNLWGTVSRGFRGGDFNGAAIDDLDFRVTDAEFLTAYEIGIKSDLLDNKLRLNVSGYFYEYTDKIGFIEIPFGRGNLGNLSILENFGDVDIYGVDVEALWEPVENLSLIANYAYIDSEYVKTTYDLGFGGGNVDGNTTPGTPENSFTGIVNYAWTLPGVGEMSLQYRGSWRDLVYFTDANNQFDFQESFWLHNASLKFTAPGGNWDIGVWVKNLANKDYLIDGFFFLNEEIAYAGVPRTYGLSAAYRF